MKMRRPGGREEGGGKEEVGVFEEVGAMEARRRWEGGGMGGGWR
jgi:hypothetical protein